MTEITQTTTGRDVKPLQVYNLYMSKTKAVEVKRVPLNCLVSPATRAAIVDLVKTEGGSQGEIIDRAVALLAFGEEIKEIEYTPGMRIGGGRSTRMSSGQGQALTVVTAESEPPYTLAEQMGETDRFPPASAPIYRTAVSRIAEPHVIYKTVDDNGRLRDLKVLLRGIRPKGDKGR